MTNFLRILIGGIMWASTAHAVSQVGGGKLTNREEGFSLRLPIAFNSNYQMFANGGVQLRGPMIFGGGFGSERFSPGAPELINIYLAGTSLPELKDVASRASVREFFGARGWTGNSVANPCVEMQSKLGDGAINVALLWGAGHGIEIVTPATAAGREGLRELIDSLALDPGACAWK